MAQRRTTHRSSTGKKLYAVRKADGTFSDIQTYQRAHAADLRSSAKGESSAKSKKVVAAKSATKTARAAAKKASGSAGGLFARAKKAVAGVMKQVTSTQKTATKSPAKKSARKAPRKTAKKAASSG